jgi:copper chaperone
MTATIIIICAAALIGYAVYGTIQKARGKAKSSCCGTPEATTKVKVEDKNKDHYPYRYTLTIANMMCANCARNVENTLNSMDGIWAKVNLEKNEADVRSKHERTEQEFADAFNGSSYGVADFAVRA